MRPILIATLIFAILFVAMPGIVLSSSQVLQQYQQSTTLEQKEDYAQAIAALVPVYKDSPKSYTVNLRLGWLSYLNKSYRNSQFHYGKASEVAPSAIEPLLGLSLPLMAQSRWSDVEQLMYRILKKDFYNFYANIRLSIALRNNKQYELAEKVDRKMLELFPTNLDFLSELGSNLYYQNKMSEAASTFSYVLVLDHKNTTAQYFIEKIQGKKNGR